MADQADTTETEEERASRSQMWKHEDIFQWLIDEGKLTPTSSGPEVIAAFAANRNAYRKTDRYAALVASHAESSVAEREQAKVAREAEKAERAAARAAAKAEKDAAKEAAAKAKAEAATAAEATPAPAKATRKGKAKAAAAEAEASEDGEDPFA